MNIKILYIGGAGRSGSTILDMLLGQNDEISNYGEINKLFTSGWINNEYCSCGSRVNECEFWRRIRKDWEAQSIITLKEYVRLQNKFLKLRNIFLLWKNMFKEDKEFRVFKMSTHLLYEIIAKHSDGNIIIDSSKSPIRLFALKIMGFDIGVIHLVRDGRGVANSFKKHFDSNAKNGVQKELKPKSIIKIAIIWVINNLLMQKLGRDLDYLFVRYEDILSKSIVELNRISRFFDIDLTKSIHIISEDKELMSGHIVAGNRLRMKEHIKIRTNSFENWKNLTRKDIRLFEFLAGWLLKKYNYKV
jgi:hypothetical protein